MASPHILLTRPAAQIETTATRLEAAGYTTHALPLTRIAPPARQPRQADCRWAEQADWWIFTSRNAVDAACTIWPTAPQARIIAIGKATAAQLRAQRWPVHWTPPGGSSESLLGDPAAPSLQGRVALMAGSGGRRQIKQQLRARGCEIRKLLLYRRVGIDYAAAELNPLLDLRPKLVFSSGHGLRQWARLMQAHKLAQGLTLDTLVASPRLCKLARQLGFGAALRALPTMSDDALLTALNEWTHDRR